jgi:hypothetical protein
MSVTRRGVLKGFAVAAATAATGASHAFVPPRALLVYDSRVAASLALTEKHAGAAVDLVEERAERWRTLRSLRSRGPVIGLTGWSDFVQVRAALEPRGLRVRAEARCGRLFYWEMS